MKNKINKNLPNKTAVITGSTGGLGKEISLSLAKLNYNLIFVNRNIEKSKDFKNEILNNYPNIEIQIIQCDFSNFEDVKKTTQQLQNYNFDILILNAAIYNVPLEKTSTGYNNIFQTNFVSPYYMAKQLLPKLKQSQVGKVIAVGSIAHNYSKTNENDIDFSTYKKASKIYGNSKRFLMFSLFELFKEEKDVMLSICHPGITLTNMTNHYPKAINWLVKIGIKLIFPNPKKACRSIIYALENSTPYHYWIGPKVFNIFGKPKIKKLHTCSIKESENIYKIAENIYKNL